MRLCRLVSTALGVITVSCARSTGSPIAPPAIAFTDVTVVDVISGSTIPNQTVVVRGNRIADITPALRGTIPPGAKVVDGSGKYMIPGLWDMHVHAFTSPESTMTIGARAVDVYFPQFLTWGVTGIRDMGGWIDTVFAIRRRVRSHEIQGPRIVSAGALIGGRNPWAPPSPHAWIVTNPDSVAPVVDSLRRAGADFIKVHDFLSRDVYFAVARAARKAKLPLVGHMRPSVTLAEAIDGGQVGIEHMPIELIVACAGGGSAEANAFYDQWGKGGWAAFVNGTVDLWGRRDRAVCADAFARMKKSAVRLTPTMVLRMQDSALVTDLPLSQLTPNARTICAQAVKDWGSVPDTVRRRYYSTVAAVVRAIHDAGVPVLAGTDGPGACLSAGWALHKEMESLVNAGFTPLDALRAATIEPARFLGFSDSLGTIRTGMVADLVLLDANPLQDIRNTRRIAAVVADGRLYRKTAPTIAVDPHRAEMDSPISVKVSGVAPGSRFTVRATMTDRSGRAWQSFAVFVTPRISELDAARAQPLDGTYESENRDALLTSMKAVGDTVHAVRFASSWRDTVVTVFQLELADRVVATDTLRRTFVATNIKATAIDAEGIKGTLLENIDGAARPGVLVIGGSEGGDSEAQVAAQLAAHGFTTMSLAYFGADGLPQQLDRIPLEYFDHALEFFARRATVAGPIGLLGTSKGAEAALLVAARSTRLGAVVAYAPSSVVWSCICDSVDHSSWSVAGLDVPAIGPGSDPSYHRLAGQPLQPRVNYLYRLRTSANSKAASIPVGSIVAPILLIAGEDDRLWPSALMAQTLADNFSRFARRSGARVVIYKGAGHLISKSLLPAGSTRIAGGRIETGGTPAGNAAAGADAWDLTVAFLRKHLGGGSTQ